MSNVYPLTADTCDFSGTTCDDDEIERAGLNWDTTLRLVKAIDDLPKATVEQTDAAAVSPVQDASPETGSFYAGVRDWWGTGQHFPIGHTSASIAEAKAWAEKLAARETRQDPEETASDDEENDLHQALRELAIESGKAADILRNKDLVSLTALGEHPSNTSDDEVDLQTFLELMRATPSHLEADRMLRGSPVSLLERRDISKPFQQGLGGKVLVDLGRANGGVQLVDKELLPKRRYLSNGPASEGGVRWVEGVENVCYKRPKFAGRG
jgi:hypothetical protein